jgi:hypothetical protein
MMLQVLCQTVYDLIAQNGSFVKFVERWIVDPTRWGPAALTVLKFADGQNIKKFRNHYAS